MIIKKFVEKDSRSVMAKVRDEFGADAVVLSSRRIGDSFEMVAAANYEEYDVLQQIEREESAGNSGPAGVVHLPNAPEPRQAIKSDVSSNRAANEPALSAPRRLDAFEGPTLKTLQTELADLKALIKNELPKYSKRSSTQKAKHLPTLKARAARLGLSPGFSEELLKDLDESESLRNSWQKLVNKLSEKLKKNEETLIESGGIAAFIGPAGSGKTSTVAKVAAAHLMAHGRGSVGVITTGGLNDPTNGRLTKFTRAMDIPCKEAKTATQLKAALEEFASMNLVLIDTPGVDSGDLRLNMQLAEFRLANYPIDSYLVVSAESGGKRLEKTINAFSRYNLVGLVVTKIDKSLSLGGVIETLIRKKAPLSYISDGARIPGDLHRGGARDIMKHALVKISSGKSNSAKSKKIGRMKRVTPSVVGNQQRAVG